MLHKPATLCRLLSGEATMNVFDRKTKRVQRNRTANLENYKVYEYLREEVRLKNPLPVWKSLFNSSTFIIRFNSKTNFKTKSSHS